MAALRDAAIEELHGDQKRQSIQAIKFHLERIVELQVEIDRHEARIAELDAGSLARQNDYGRGQRWE